MSGEARLRLGDAILAALPLAVRAAGFEDAIGITCEKVGWDSVTLVPELEVVAVHGRDGILEGGDGVPDLEDLSDTLRECALKERKRRRITTLIDA